MEKSKVVKNVCQNKIAKRSYLRAIIRLLPPIFVYIFRKIYKQANVFIFFSKCWKAWSYGKFESFECFLWSTVDQISRKFLKKSRLCSQIHRRFINRGQPQICWTLIMFLTFLLRKYYNLRTHILSEIARKGLKSEL